MSAAATQVTPHRAGYHLAIDDPLFGHVYAARAGSSGSNRHGLPKLRAFQIVGAGLQDTRIIVGRRGLNRWRAQGRFRVLANNTICISAAGAPAINLPIGLDSHDLPIGLELDGPESEDRTLLGLTAHVENLANAQAMTF